MTPVKYDALTTILSLSTTLGGATLSFNVGQLIATDALGLYFFAKAQAANVFTQYYFANTARAMAHEFITSTCLGFVANVVLSVALTALSMTVLTLAYNIFVARKGQAISICDLCSYAWSVLTFNSKNQSEESSASPQKQEREAASLQRHSL